MKISDENLLLLIIVMLLVITSYVGYAVGYQVHQDQIKDSYYDYGVYTGYANGIGQCTDTSYKVSDLNGTVWVQYSYEGVFDKSQITQVGDVK
jgi:hypothetical protein